LLAAYPDRLRLMVTLRSDFEPQFRNTPLESFWQAGRFVVPAMSREELREVIEEPASAKVVYFESREDRGDLVDRLIDEVAGMPGSLPLLSFALSELYLKLARRYLEAQKTDMTVDRVIAWIDYDELGGVTKSLTRRADEEYEELVKIDPAYGDTIRHLMLRTIALGGELARRQVPESELKYPEPENTRVQKAIERFLSARLLVSAVDVSNKPYIEPAHDALVRGWEKLRAWKTEKEESLLLQRRLTPAAEEWEKIVNNDKEQPKGLLDKADVVLDRLERILLPVTNLVVRIPRSLRRLKPTREQQHSSGKNARFLWNANPYIDVLAEQLNTSATFFNQNETAFIQASVLRKHRNTHLWWWGTFVFVSVLSGLTFTALWNQNEAKKAQFNSLVKSSEAFSTSGEHLSAIFYAVKAGGTISNNNVWMEFTSVFASERVFLPEQRLRQQAINILQDVGSKSAQFNRWKAHSRPATAVVFNPRNSQMLASSGEDGNIKIWNQNGSIWNQNGKNHPILKGTGSQVWSLDISDDGLQLVAGQEDGNISLWRRDATGEFKPQVNSELPREDQNINKPQYGVLMVAFNKNAFKKDTKAIAAIASARADAKVSIWDEDGNWLANLEDEQNGNKSAVYAVSFSPDGSQIVTAGYDGIKTWKIGAVKDGKLAVTFSRTLYYSKEDHVPGVAFSPDGSRIVSGHSDGTVKIWKSSDGSPWNKQPKTKNKHLAGRVRAINFSSDGNKIVSSGEDGVVKVWDKDGGLLETFSGHGADVRFASFNADGSLIASVGGKDNTIQLWKQDRMLKNQTLSDFKDAVYAVDFSRDADDSWVATGDKAGEVKIWKRNITGLDSLPCLLSGAQKHQRMVQTLAFVPHSSILASADANGKIIFWDLPSKQKFSSCQPFSQSIPIGEGHQENEKIVGLAFNSDGSEMATISNHEKKGHKPVRKLVLWQRQKNRSYQQSQEPISVLDPQHPENDVKAVQFSPDNKILAIAHNNKTVMLWRKDVNGKVENKPFDTLPHESAVRRIAFSPDSSILASANMDGVIRIWRRNLQGTYQFAKAFAGHNGEISSLAFHPGGNLIASGSHDQAIKLWSLDSDQSIDLSLHKDKIFGIAFSADGKNLASIDMSEKLVYWNLSFLDLKWLLKQNCNWIKDYLQNSNYVEEKDRKLCSRISD
jgi:WD40 repeat protein